MCVGPYSYVGAQSTQDSWHLRPCLLDEKSKDLCQFCQMTFVEKVIELLESGEGMLINCTLCFSICSKSHVFLLAGAHNQIKA